MVSLKKNTSYKAFSCIIFMLCILLVTPVLVSSATFDNVKSFDDKIGDYGKVTIKDWFGLLNLAELELKENTFKQCVDCSAEIEIVMHQDGILIDDVKFVGGEVRDYEFYIKTGEEEYDVDDYETQCVDGEYISNNDTFKQICSRVKTGSHKETENVYEIYNLRDEVQAGTYYVRLEGTKDIEKEIDWQITSQGKLIDEWALWGAGSRIIAYYSLDEGTGIVGESLPDIKHNVTFTSGIDWREGILGGGVYFDGSELGTMKGLDLDLVGATEMSVSLWFNSTGSGDGTLMFAMDQPTFTVFFIRIQIGTDSFVFNQENGYVSNIAGGQQFDDGFDWDTNTWYHVVITTNYTGAYGYINGVFKHEEASLGSNNPYPASNVNLSIGGRSIPVPDIFFIGEMDEIQVFNRTLTLAEITSLYNGGNPTSPINSITTTLNSPANDIISLTGAEQVFNCSTATSVGSTVVNISLWTNQSGTWVLNETEDYTGIGGTKNTSIFTKRIAEEFDWTCRGFSSNGLGGFASSNRTLFVSDIIQTNQSFITPIQEGSTAIFYVNVTNGQASLTPTLVYDSVNYLGSFTQDGSEFYVSRTLDIPPVSEDTNVTFYWSFLMSDTSVINLSNNNVTVTNFAMDNCTDNTIPIMNITLNNEENNTIIIDPNSNLEVEIEIFSLDDILIGELNLQTNKTNLTICVANLTNAEYNLYSTIGFSADSFVNEFYFIDKAPLNLSTIPINISLMDLKTADSTSFLFNYFDEDGLKVSNPIIHTWRKYIGEGLFREVERSKQNDDGDTIVHLVEEDVIYYFQVSQNNTVIFTSQTYTALCDDTPCTITLEESGGYQDFDTDWDLIDNGAYTMISNAVTREVNLTFETTTPSTWNLTVYKLNSELNYEPVGSAETTGTSGTISVIVPDESGNFSFFAVAEQDDKYLISNWIDMSAEANEYFGSTLALFLGLLIILSLGLMAISEGSGTIVFIILGMLLTVALGLINYKTTIGSGLIIYFVVTGGIIIWKLTRRNR